MSPCVTARPGKCWLPLRTPRATAGAPTVPLGSSPVPSLFPSSRPCTTTRSNIKQGLLAPMLTWGWPGRGASSTPATLGSLCSSEGWTCGWFHKTQVPDEASERASPEATKPRSHEATVGRMSGRVSASRKEAEGRGHLASGASSSVLKD